MKPTTPGTIARTCAAFEPHGDTDGGPICWNATSFKDAATGAWERIEAGFCCDGHQTTMEDAAQTAFIEANRPAIWAAIRAKAGEQHTND